MDQELIAFLMKPAKVRQAAIAAKRNSSATTKFAYVADPDMGIRKVSIRKATTTKVGSYDGKLGTTVRSRKGRTYRKANGRVWYNQPELDVIAYKV